MHSQMTLCSDMTLVNLIFLPRFFSIFSSPEIKKKKFGDKAGKIFPFEKNIYSEYISLSIPRNVFSQIGFDLF